MPTYQHPGVYVEEIPSGSKPIEAVGTSTAAFVGYATKGPIGTPQLIFKWDDYAQQYGGIRDTKLADPIDQMGYSVSAFFQNGGKKAYIVRLTEGANAAHVAHVSFLAPNQPRTVQFTAASEGSWGNAIHVTLERDASSELYQVKVGKLLGHGAKPLTQRFEEDERFTNLRLDDENHPDYLPTRINDQSRLIRAEVHTQTSESLRQGRITSGDLSELKPSDLNGNRIGFSFAEDESNNLRLTFPDGAFDTTNSTPEDVRLKIQQAIDQNEKAIDAAAKAHFSRVLIENNEDNKPVLVLELEAIASEANPNVEVRANRSAVNILKFQSTQLVETHGALPLRIGSIASGDISRLDPVLLNETDIAFAVLGDEEPPLHVNFKQGAFSANSTLEDVRLKIQEAIEQRKTDLPKAISRFKAVSIDEGQFVLALETISSTPNVKISVSGTATAHLTFSDTLDESLQWAQNLTDGGDGNRPTKPLYDSALAKLVKLRDISIICLPGKTYKDPEDRSIIDSVIGHAEKMTNRMVIVDPPDGEPDVLSGGARPNSTYSVMYYPWVKVANPHFDQEQQGQDDTPDGGVVSIPPSGFAAGMWSKIDRLRGVWKAPAGVETSLLGVAGLQHTVGDKEQDGLNPLGVNVIRQIPGFGPVIWGARTLATKTKPEWRYVPVRRTAILIEQSVYNGIQWAVFEPNDPRLWSSLRANIGSFMNGLFRAGEFQGQKASDAYFVRCGLDDTMTQGDIDRGQTIVIVGFAPLKPAEFVIVRIQQKVGQS